MNLSNTKDEFLELVKIVKEYVILNKDYTLLQMTEKLSQLLASLLLVLILLGIGLSTLLFLMFSGAYALAPFVGGLSWSALIFAGISILLMIIFYVNKTKWLLSPIIGFVSALLIEGTSAERQANTKAEAEQEMKAAQQNSMDNSTTDNQMDDHISSNQNANGNSSTHAQREPSIRVVPIGTIPSQDSNTITPTGSSSSKKSKK